MTHPPFATFFFAPPPGRGLASHMAVLITAIAGKCMSMTVTIRPASLWTHAKFAMPADLRKTGLCAVDVTKKTQGLTLWDN